MQMGPSRRDLCVLWIVETRFCDVRRETSKGGVAASSGGGNMGE